MSAAHQSPIVVFDFDGTLVCSNAIKDQAFRWTADAYGLDHKYLDSVRAELPRSNRHIIFRTLAQRLTETGMSAVPTGETLAATYGELCTDAIATCPWVPGAREALQHLAARGTRMFVNSATPTDGLLAAVEAVGITQWFEDILGGPASKQDNLLSIAKSSRCPPDRIIMVGDGEDDRRGATEFGCHFIGIELPEDMWGRPNHRFAHPPDHCMTNLYTLPKYVDRLMTTS